MLRLFYSIIKNEKQKDNLAKFSYDIAKIIIAIAIISPIVKLGTINLILFIVFLVVSLLFLIFGSLLDKKEV